MNCYDHPSVVAVGTCKSCGKGLCPSCAVDMTKGLACRGRCEQDVAAVIGLIERNIRISPASEQILKATRSNRYLAPIFYLAFGLCFLGFALYHYAHGAYDTADSLLVGMGAIFMILGAVVLKRAIALGSSPS